MLRIILLRHGETLWNIEGRFQGQEDTALSERGLAQGHALALALKNISVDAAVSSPLQRSYLTCKMAADEHGIPVKKDPRLTEISHGKWEGIRADEILQLYPREFALWHTHPEQVQMPDGESLEDVRRRARAAFDEYTKTYDGKTLLVAAHDAVNKVILCDLMGLGMDHFWQIKQDNCCINVVEYDNGTWRLVNLNVTGHLGYLISGIEQKGL